MAAARRCGYHLVYRFIRRVGVRRTSGCGCHAHGPAWPWLLRMPTKNSGHGPRKTRVRTMNASAVPSLTRAPAIAELDILWLTAGLSCDGDTVSITAATQPSLEDLLLGALPGI